MRLSNLGIRLNHALLFVLMIAVGFAAMRTGSKLLATILLYSVYFILVVGTILGLSPGRNRGACVAFAAFGWAYFLPIFVFGSKEMIAQTPTDLGLKVSLSQLFKKPLPPLGFAITSLEPEWPMITFSFKLGTPAPPTAFRDEITKYNDKIISSSITGHSWLTLIFSGFAFLVFKQRKWKNSRT